MRIMSLMLGLWTGVATCVPLAAQGNDAVQLHDGRFVFGPKMTRTKSGITIHFDAGAVEIPAAMVKEATCTDSEAGSEIEVTPAAAEKIAKGLVLFEGAWMKKDRRDEILNKRRVQREASIAEARAHQAWRDRYQRSSKNFAFEFTIDPERMDEFESLMEVYFAFFAKEWKVSRPSSMPKLKVCFYHDPEYYYQVSGAQRGAIGYFKFVPPEELNFYYDRLDERLTIDVMFHETNHYLTHLIDPRFHYPSWVNESLAEYYGASHWDPVKKTMSVGHLQEGRLAVIKDAITGGSYQGLEDLIRTPQANFNAIHYAWGWSLVHYLLESKYQKDFKRYYIALAKDKSIKKTPTNFNMVTVEPDAQIEALKAFLKIKDLKDLEKEWHAYVDGLEQATARGYSEAGATVLARGMAIKATRFFQTAIEKGADDAMTWYNLSQAHEQKNRYDDARQCIDKALERDPLNGAFYVRKARVVRAKNDFAWNDEVERLCKLAVEVEPDNLSVLMDVDLLRAFEKSGVRTGGGNTR